MRFERRAWLLLPILLLSLIHGGLYASYMPAWGLLDEEQHFHYIESVVEQGAIPVVGKTMLSAKIVDSVFETRRWEHFGWPAPPSRDPVDMGLEGHSYEGYQPPLYYVALAPLFAVWPGSILSRLFALRWASVALSLISVVLVFHTARLLFGDKSPLPYLASLLMAIIPERVAAAARVSNDIAVEVTAAAVILICTAICLRGMSWRSSILLGAMFGLSMLSKVTGALLILPIAMTLWPARRNRQVLFHSMLIAGATGLLVTPWVVRNLRVYGDLTGSSSFDRIAGFSSPAFSVLNLANALRDLVRHFWFIWWKGGSASGNWLTLMAEILLGALLLSSVFGLIDYIRAGQRADRTSQQLYVLHMYIVTVTSYITMTLLGYFGDNLPILGGKLPIPVVPSVLQGRYLLPVISPIVILFTVGLWQLRLRNLLLPAAVAGLAALSLVSLFGNLVIYHYFWGPLVARGITADYLAYPDRLRFLVSELLRDRPPAVRVMLTPLLLLFSSLSFAAAVSAGRVAGKLGS